MRINGESVDVAPGSYAVVQREWQNGDTVELSLPMQIELIRANPRVEEDRSGGAIRRGPVVFCVEQVDAPDVNLMDLYLPQHIGGLQAVYEPSLLGGVVTIVGSALVDTVAREQQPLYVPASQYTPPRWREVNIRWIPYYAWANRGAGAMKVWLPLP